MGKSNYGGLPNSTINWKYEGTPDNWSSPPNVFDRLLYSGEYKPQQSDSLDGPWEDCKVLDNGDIIVTKRYISIEKKCQSK